LNVFFSLLISLFTFSFFWERTSAVGQSEAHLRWIVPADTPDGEYRISHYGHYKNIDASIVPYNGTTQSFNVSWIRKIVALFSLTTLNGIDF
jgi:hypothetical protein